MGFWMIVGVAFGSILAIGVVMQIQKGKREPFYPEAERDFTVSERADNPGGKNIPIL